MTFLTYLLESSVCAAILWIAYYALLRKEAHFAFNRFYLLSIIPLSIIIPLLRLPLLPPLLPPEEYSPVIIENFSAEPLAAPVTHGFSFITPLLIIYFSGAGFVAFRFIKQFCHMRRVMAASRFSDTKNYSAFTFFRKIYINSSTLSAGDYEKILWHEQVHARQLHSMDLIVVQLFLIFQWFNPLAWALKKSIVATHEYLADAQVLARGVDINIYQKLLFHQTTGAYPEYANGFSYSLTKKRLIMMTKNNRGKFFALKLCCLLPAMALPVALFGLSTAETKPPVNKETAVATTIANDTLRVTVTDDDAQAGVIVIAMKSGDTLVFNGYDKQALNALNPDDIQSITVQKEKMAAQSVPSAVTGTITVVKKSGETIIFDPDDINSITVQKDTAKSMVKYTRVEDSTKTYYYFKKDTAKTKKEKVYLVGKVDVNPEFPGGMSALSKFIKDNLKYPKEAADKKIEGRVTVEFIVKADGSIDDIKVLKGVDALLDAEALHIIKILPNWTPGKLKGKAVAVKFILPISFQIPKDKAPETK